MAIQDQTAVAATTTASIEGFDSLSVPTFRGSTILYPDYQSFVSRGDRGFNEYSYGLHGTPTTNTLRQKLTGLEGGVDTLLAPSGLMAITTAMLAVLEAGDVVALPETVYAPVRRFAATTLRKFGIESVFYDPVDLATLEVYLDRLRLIWVESPGSITMEVQDIPAICVLAARHDILVGCDNSWASPLLSKPLELGADIVVEALTKYLSGHSDVLLGSITVRSNELAQKLHQSARSLGLGVSPDDCFLVLRGVEAAAVRLTHIGATALILAQAIERHPSVEHVLHPALPAFPTHTLWKRQFSGSSGLFSFVMRGEPEAAFAARFSRLNVCRIGASWGGVQTLLAPVDPAPERTFAGGFKSKHVVRMSIGLEAADDLLADVNRFLA